MGEIAAVCQCGKVTQEMIKGLCLDCDKRQESETREIEAHERPPQGLKPRFLLDEAREADILSAVTRFHMRGLEVPVEWLEELQEIKARQAFRTAVKSISTEFKVTTAQAKEIVRSAFERGVGRERC